MAKMLQKPKVGKPAYELKCSEENTKKLAEILVKHFWEKDCSKEGVLHYGGGLKSKGSIDFKSLEQNELLLVEVVETLGLDIWQGTAETAMFGFLNSKNMPTDDAPRQAYILRTMMSHSRRAARIPGKGKTQSEIMQRICNAIKAKSSSSSQSLGSAESAPAAAPAAAAELKPRTLAKQLSSVSVASSAAKSTVSSSQDFDTLMEKFESE